MMGAKTRAREGGRRAVLAGALMMTTALASPLSATESWAQQAAASAPTIAQLQSERSFDIPAQPLTDALVAFGQQSSVQVTVDGTVARNVSSPAVRGTMTSEQALRRLLAGSGLTYTMSGSTVAIEKLPQDGDSGIIQLGPVTVIGTAQSRYDSRDTETGTRIPKDVTEISRSIDIIPEQLLLDQQARELEDVFKLSPNVVNGDGFGGTVEDYFVRGFRRKDNIYRNGVRLKSSSRFDPATLDSVQIIKGPVADIGQMAPGGLVNVVTKKPRFENEASIETNFDEHGQRRATLDATGPLGESEEFAYRITASGEDSETFRDFSKVDRQFVSSSLAWVGESGTEVTLNHEYSDDERSMDRGFITVPVGGDRRAIPGNPVSQRFDAPFGEREGDYNLFEFDSAVPLGDSAWALESKLLYVTENTEDVRTEVRNVATDGTLTRRVSGNRDRDLDTTFGRLQMHGEVELLLPAELVVGAEFREQNEDWINFAGADQVGGTVANPNPGLLVNDSGNPTSQNRFETKQKSYGPYAQLDVAPAENVNLTFGLRHEYFEGGFQQTNLGTGAVTTVEQPRDSQFTKSAGVVWKPVQSLSLYASYADTFFSQSIFGNQEVAVLPPEEGSQYEVGTKWATLGDKLLLTAAVFDIEQENVVETVNGVPQLTGGIDTRGIELTGVGNPLPGWNIRAGLGLLDAEIVSNDPETDGNRPRNVPEITASLWTSYELTETGSVLDGLGLGAGITHIGNRFGDSEHTFELGDYTLVDAGAWYYLPVADKVRLRFDLGVKNITDERYFTASGGTFRIGVGAPRTVFGGVRLEVLKF